MKYKYTVWQELLIPHPIVTIIHMQEQLGRKNNEKKKLLYCITKSNWGGAQKYVYELAVHFAQSGGYDVAVALGGEGVLKERLLEAGIRVIPIHGLERDVGLNEFAVFSRLYKIFKTERPNIVHLNSSKIGGIGTLAGRAAKVPRIIFTAHGWAFQEEWRSSLAQKLIWFFSFFTVVFSHKIIVISKAQYRQTPKLFFLGNKITTITNGIVPPCLLERETTRRALRNFSLGERKPLWVGTIGELHKNKGHEYAIEAVRMVVEGNTDVIFVIIGEGEECENLEKLIVQKELGGHVFLLGSRNNAAELLHAFDLFLFPSLKEGHPYAVLEAGAAGLPVIASGVGGIPDIITDMENGILVRPKTPGEIVRAINYLFDHPGAAEKFGKKLKQKVAKSFSFAKMAKETERVYKEA